MLSADAHALLFKDRLASELVLPVAFSPQPPYADTSAEMRLRAVALVEDGRIEDSEERQEKGIALQRIEAKMDLLMGLCARLLALSTDTPLIPAPVVLSAIGIQITLADKSPLPATGEQIGLTLQIADWLPDPIVLPARLLGSEPGQGHIRAWFAFDSLSSSTADALERHVFRLHRRHVAHQRQGR